jgi:hypothetical protein
LHEKDVVLTGIALAVMPLGPDCLRQSAYAQAAGPGRLDPVPFRYPAPSGERALNVANLNAGSTAKL